MEDMTVQEEIKIKEACARWLKYGELACIEIDTETGEARVMKASEF